MRIGLGRNQNLDIVSTQDTLRLFSDETVDEDLLVDVSELVRIGEYFEVDAVIVGSYDFFASEPAETLLWGTLFEKSSEVCHRLSGLP